MGEFLKSLSQFVGRRGGLAEFPMKAVGQHGSRFVLALLTTLLLVGAAPAVFDWNEDARWELRSEGQVLYRLNETMAELGAPGNDQEMFVLPVGLLVRQTNSRAVNLTVLKGKWDMLRNGQVVGRVGESLEQWQSQVGEPLTVFANPQKVGLIYYYRASLLDLGLMVAEGKVLSIMFVEPGYLRSALERSGYSPKS